MDAEELRRAARNGVRALPALVILLALWVMAGLGVELHLTGITMRQFDIEYSGNLTNWNWWGSMTTTSAVVSLTLQKVTTNGPAVQFWRVVER